MPEGASCWMELYNLPGCYAWWHDYRQPEGPLTWTGACSGGLAQGYGTLKLVARKLGSQLPWWEETGTLKDGKKIGPWINSYFAGIHGGYSKGRYEDGKEQGHWEIGFHLGGAVGFYDKGERTGIWIEEYFRTLRVGTYWRGQRHGRWIVRDHSPRALRPWRGYLKEEGSYLHGERHGPWIEYDRYPGSVRDTFSRGSYANGKRRGRWILWSPDGDLDVKDYGEVPRE